MTLHTAEIRRLAKLLGMVGSAHDGEALVAARKAHELVANAGITWSDVLGLSRSDQDNAQAPEIPHHALAVELLKATELTAFERKFLKGIFAFQKLTEKQAATLETIRAKVAMKTRG